MRILSKYILRQFILTLLFSLIALSIIFVIVNILESLDDFLDQKATLKIIVNYYIYYLPEILKILTPVSVLLASLFSIGRMSTLNEITAMKSGSMSLYQLMTPLIILTMLLSFGQLYFNGWVVPKAEHFKFQIEQKYLLKSGSGGPVVNLYFRDNPLKNVLIQYYDGTLKQGNGVAIEDFSSETTPRLVKRIDAQKINWDSTKSMWKLEHCIIRDYAPNSVQTIQLLDMYVHLDISNDEISELKRSTDEMTFPEYKSYLELMQRGGKDIREKLTDYYGDYAFPFANFIIILFSVPFASIKKKGGLAIQISAAMIVTFFYLLFTEISKTIGYASNINPVIVGWSANIIFLVVGIITIFKTRT